MYLHVIDGYQIWTPTLSSKVYLRYVSFFFYHRLIIWLSNDSGNMKRKSQSAMKSPKSKRKWLPIEKTSNDQKTNSLHAKLRFKITVKLPILQVGWIRYWNIASIFNSIYNSKTLSSCKSFKTFGFSYTKHKYAIPN